MANFEFDLEQAEMELNNVDNLLSVFWGFFNEERPLGKADTVANSYFVESCKTYESVINAAWDKVRQVRANMEAAIEKRYSSPKNGGEAA